MYKLKVTHSMANKDVIKMYYEGSTMKIVPGEKIISKKFGQRCRCSYKELLEWNMCLENW